MRVFLLVDDAHVIQLDIQVLINGVKHPVYRQVVLQLHRHLHKRRVWLTKVDTAEDADDLSPVVEKPEPQNLHNTARDRRSVPLCPPES